MSIYITNRINNKRLPINNESGNNKTEHQKRLTIDLGGGITEGGMMIQKLDL